MATKRDGLRMWWSKFDQLCEVLGKTVTKCVDDFIALNPVDQYRNVPLGFEEYLMRVASFEVPGLLRLCPRPFFELMDVAALIEGNKDMRNKESWTRTMPHMHPLAGTQGVAALIFDELVKDEQSKDEISFDRFCEYVQAMYKIEYATSTIEQWSLIKEQCGLRMEEKCALYTAYAADCSQFPPAVGGLYLSADHLVFQDPVLHNRRVISLNKVTEVKRVPVELRHAKLLMSQLPGMAMLSKGGIVGSLLRWGGVAPAQQQLESGVAPVGSEGQGIENLDKFDREGESGESQGVLGMTAIQMKWPGGGLAKFQFVELSGQLCKAWIKYLNEVVLSHKLAESRAQRVQNIPLNAVFEDEKIPWLPSFVAENVQRCQALEGLLGRDVPSLLLCTQNANVTEGKKPHVDGGKLVKELYCTYGAADRYKRDEDSMVHNVESFNFKVLDDNLQKLDDLTADTIEILMAAEALTTWEQPVRSAAALAGCLAIFYFDAVFLIAPGVLFTIAVKTSLAGFKRHVLGKSPPTKPSRQRGGNKSKDKDKLSPPTSPRPRGTPSADAKPGYCAQGTSARRDLSRSFQEEERGASPLSVRSGLLGAGASSLPKRQCSDLANGVLRSASSASDDVSSHQSPAKPSRGEQDDDAALPTSSSKSWLQSLGDRVGVVQKLGTLRANVRKMVEENIGQVERQLQVGLQLGREKTQKLSGLQNGVHKINRVLEKVKVLHSWEHPRKSINYVVALLGIGITLAVVPVRYLFLLFVLGKFAPRDAMVRRIKTVGMYAVRRFFETPEPDAVVPPQPEAPQQVYVPQAPVPG